MKIDKKFTYRSYDVITTSLDGHMTACEYSAMITGIACTITKDKSKEEMALLSAMFNQLARSIDTIAIYGVYCKSKEETTKNQGSTEKQKDSNSGAYKCSEKESKEGTSKDGCQDGCVETDSRTNGAFPYYDLTGLEPKKYPDINDMFNL